MEEDIYHERQSRELCALHALNNLFQEKNCFTKKDLDDIAHKLSPEHLINPHKSMFGLGNYDVNVLITALQTKDYEAIWFDRRKEISQINLDNVHGFIINIPIVHSIGYFQIHRKHWICIRKIGTNYYNLDSKLSSPQIISDIETFLQEQLLSNEKNVFVIVTKSVYDSNAWWCDDSKQNET